MRLLRKRAQLATVKELEQQGDIDALVDALDDADPVRAADAAMALGRARDPRAFDTLLEICTDRKRYAWLLEFWSGRATTGGAGASGGGRLFEALDGLVGLDDARAIDPLLDQLGWAWSRAKSILPLLRNTALTPMTGSQEHDAEVAQVILQDCAAVAAALGRFGDPRAVALLTRIGSEVDEEHDDVHWALWGRPEPHQEAVLIGLGKLAATCTRALEHIADAGSGS